MLGKLPGLGVASALGGFAILLANLQLAAVRAAGSRVLIAGLGGFGILAEVCWGMIKALAIH